MSRLHPISYGAGVLLVPDYCASARPRPRPPHREAGPPGQGKRHA